MTNLAVQLADSVKSIGVKTVYGEPVELDGITMIPVALAQFGFGAGSDSNDNGGGGGGGYSVPVGVYIRDEDGLRFEPNLITVMAVGIPFLWVAGRAGARLVKALKR